MGYTPHVLVLGGGITGTAIARDLAIRGLEVTLVDRDGLASGATGRNQGLLYSGARYAGTDARIARRSFAENKTLSDIASHCIADDGGLLVADDPETLDAVADACRECEIPVEELSGEDVRSVEPGLDEGVERALRTPEKVVDPFGLTVATAQSAVEHGATVRTHAEVTDIETADGTVQRVTVDHDPSPGEESADESGHDESTTTDDQRADGGRKQNRHPAEDRTHGSPSVPGMPGTVEQESDPEPASTPGVEELEPDYVVNATGPWVDRVAGLAGFEFPVRRSRSVLVVTDQQSVETPVVRYDGEETLSAVPYEAHTVLGGDTGVDRDGFDGEPDNTTGDPDAVDARLDEAAEVVPGVAEADVLRAFWGVRSGPPKAGREGRPFVLFDHADYHDCWGMTSVIGGSLTTHRLVAEKVTDQVCEKFGITRECRTAEMALPGGGDAAFLQAIADQFDLPAPVVERTRDRLGGDAVSVLDTDEPNPVVCEDQFVTRAEVQHALDDETASDVDLTDVRVRTSAAMGACQGGRCGHRIATQLHPEHDRESIEAALSDLLAERWTGQRPALRGRRLEQAARNYEFHASTLSRKYDAGDPDLEAFDDGPDTVDDGPPTARRGMRR